MISVISATTTKGHVNNGSSIFITLNAVPTPGNLLVVGLNSQNSRGINTIGDNQGNIYNDIFSVGTSGNPGVAILHANNINSSGPFIITITLASNDNFSVYIYEIAGLDKVNPFISGNQATNINQLPSSNIAATPSLINTNTSSIFFSILGTNSTNSNTTITPDSGWIIDNTNGKEINGSLYAAGGLDYMIVSGINTELENWGVDSNTTSYSSGIVCFDAASEPLTTEVYGASISNTGVAYKDIIVGY